MFYFTNALKLTERHDKLKYQKKIRFLQSGHDVVHVVHDGLKKVFRVVVGAIGVFAVRQRRIVLEVQFWNVVETTHE